MRLRVGGRLPSRRQIAAVTPYGLAAVVYVVVGAFFTGFLLSVFVAMGYLLVAVWLVPAVARRIR